MLDKKYVVEKSNLMTEMRNCKFTLGEQRLLAVFLSRVNPKDPSKNRTVTFTFDEFRSLLDLKSTNRVYWQNTFDSLVTKTIRFQYSTKKYSAWTTCTVFSSATMFKDEETEELTIELTANETIEHLIFDLQKYLKYQLWNCLRLSSNNQIRMYELLKQYEKVGERTISIADLKEMLGMSKNDYPVWANFKTRVLDSCQVALKENTDIYFEYEPIKKGRKFVAIKFFIYENKDHQDPLHLREFISDNFSDDIIDFEDIKAEMEERQQDPKGDIIALLQGAVENEFSDAEVNLIFNKICTFDLKHKDGIDIARYHYLAEKYAMLNVQNEKRKIHDRFKYFLTMLEKPEQIQPEMKY